MDKLFMDERTKKKMEDEIKSLSALDHPNILKMHEYFEDDCKYYIVTDIYKGGELFDEIQARGKFSEKDAAALVR